ncbi:hypothetical protein HanRHA438_Chr06g0282941 [Helianthus annuus]|uniref:Uncharacterized protein n=1 Tax=Helianthus annuus TaxID=4232 RepID=A0A9K3IX82_HELAN|nr:hypothetical protein HanXRQr2_Chr06g0273911 [Helianthus annuus]KAJ0561569.1 hypothetical protein HanHA300_Chr06g0224471 [Helianthus annuus]KAJ0568285.1 hypothetical protein HanIR_Chr06g0294461 [Helianthus annuus]KAJ0574634.1 hypothetical protein HanHA89_Chr06g0240431 [Helianthus annuus]KAJ0913202.1 hypothetical protein HanRHA438_Chr06g0282941 [Helianthus annuus]
MLFLAAVSAVMLVVVLGDGGLLLGVATRFAVVAALSCVLLVPAIMKCHSEPFSLCDD